MGFGYNSLTQAGGEKSVYIQTYRHSRIFVKKGKGYEEEIQNIYSGSADSQPVSDSGICGICD